MKKHLREIYSRAAQELQEKYDKYFETFRKNDAKKRALVKAGKLSQADYLEWRRRRIFDGKRWENMKDNAAKTLANVDQMAMDYLNGKLPEAYATSYNLAMERIIGQIPGIDISFDLVDPYTVRELSLAKDSKLFLPYKKLDPKKDIPWNKKRLNGELLQGILQGESMDQIAKRLVDVCNGNEAAAMRAARTAINTVENGANHKSAEDLQDEGALIVHCWLDAEDGRVREWHSEAGDRYRDRENGIPLDEPFIVDGEKMMYPGDPGGSPANVYNCFVGETNIATDSEVIRSYKHNYSGRFVTVKTAGGVNFTCTPNHPILTIGGWVKAESLQNGDNLIVTFGQKDFSLRVNPNVNHAFPRIDAIHEFLDKMGGERTCSLSVNFHGDIPTSDVEIITKKRLLREGRNSGAFNSINKFLLKHSDKSFLRDSTFVEHFWRVCKPALCIVSGFSKAFSLVWRSLRHPEIHRLRPIALLYSGRVKPLDNDAARNAELISECLDGFSGFVFADNIVSVDFSSGCSHVYNLQTENGYYFVNSSIAQSKRKSNGIFAIAHNCRCVENTWVNGFKSTLPKDKQGKIHVKVRFV